MIHELELLPIVVTQGQVATYIFKIFLLLFLFFGQLNCYLICLLNVLLLNLVSTFSVVLASSTTAVYCGNQLTTLCQVSRQLAGQLTQHKKNQHQVLPLSCQLGSKLNGKKNFCIALALLLMPQLRKYSPGVICLYKQRGQYSELGRTTRKIQEIARKQLCGYFPFSFSNSNIYFYQIIFSLSTLLSASQLQHKYRYGSYQIASYKSLATNNMGLSLKSRGKI